MNIQKAHWHSDGDNVRVTMPLQKVDKENRIVSGWATLDNIDTSDDVVLSSASTEAFANFRGNIRLMHQPIPAGKLVDFREDSYYDPKTQKFYNGIYVDVYISKGAPQVWEMVLDGTLTGFSIGGKVTETENHFAKDAGKPVRLIKKYNLIELSLVDSPANQLCDVVSITKAADGTLSASGMVTEVVAENVFWCGTDNVAFTSQEESKDCSACGGPTDNIGWFESDGGDKTEKVNAIVADFVKADTVEGRLNDMADDITEAEEVEVEVQEDPTPLETVEEAEAGEDIEALGTDTAVEAEIAEDEVEEEAAEEEVAEEVEEEVEKAVEAPAEEATEEEAVDFGKMFADFADAIQAQVQKMADELATFAAVANKVDEIGQAQAELAEKFSAVNETVDHVKKSYDTVEKSVGNKKSGDLGGSTEGVVEKSAKPSLWNGRFFGSVNNI